MFDIYVYMQFIKLSINKHVRFLYMALLLLTCEIWGRISGRICKATFLNFRGIGERTIMVEKDEPSSKMMDCCRNYIGSLL